MSQLFASVGQIIGGSASVLPMNILELLPLGLTGLISLQSKELSRVFSSTTIQKHNYLVLSLLYGQTLTSIHDYWKTIALTIGTFVDKVMSLLFNMLSRFQVCHSFFSKCQKNITHLLHVCVNGKALGLMDDDEIYHQDKSILGEERERGVLEAYWLFFFHIFFYFVLYYLCKNLRNKNSVSKDIFMLTQMLLMLS